MTRDLYIIEGKVNVVITKDDHFSERSCKLENDPRNVEAEVVCLSLARGETVRVDSPPRLLSIKLPYPKNFGRMRSGLKGWGLTHRTLSCKVNLFPTSCTC